MRKRRPAYLGTTSGGRPPVAHLFLGAECIHGGMMLVGTYVKERDNNRMKGGETGVIFWSKVYYLSIRDIGEAYILYINGR